MITYLNLPRKEGYLLLTKEDIVTLSYIISASISIPLPNSEDFNPVTIGYGMRLMGELALSKNLNHEDKFTRKI